MAKKIKGKRNQSGRMLPMLHPNAAESILGRKRSLLPYQRTGQQSQCNLSARSRAIYTR